MCEICADKKLQEKVLNMASRINTFFEELIKEDEKIANHAINGVMNALITNQVDIMKALLSRNNETAH